MIHLMLQPSKINFKAPYWIIDVIRLSETRLDVCTVVSAGQSVCLNHSVAHAADRLRAVELRR